jgi:hypothetical protein
MPDPFDSETSQSFVLLWLDGEEEDTSKQLVYPSTRRHQDDEEPLPVMPLPPDED